MSCVGNGVLVLKNFLRFKYFPVPTLGQSQDLSNFWQNKTEQVRGTLYGPVMRTRTWDVGNPGSCPCANEYLVIYKKSNNYN